MELLNRQRATPEQTRQILRQAGIRLAGAAGADGVVAGLAQQVRRWVRAGDGR